MKARVCLAVLVLSLCVVCTPAQTPAGWSNVLAGPWNAGCWMDGTISDAVVFDDGSGPDLYLGGHEATLVPGGVVDVPMLTRGIAGACMPSLPSPGAGGGRIEALAVFDDGTGPGLYAAGSFASAGGVTATHIARWDGATWSTLAGGVTGAGPFGGSIRALAVFDDGGGPALVASGFFTMIGSATAANIAKWDGTSWSPLGAGLSGGTATTLAVYDDGTGPALYAAGDFGMAGGQPANGIARWDGTTWSALGSGASAVSGVGWLQDLQVYDDGTGPALYGSGWFTTMDGVPAENIARWDGTAWSAVGGGLTGWTCGGCGVQALAVFDDGTGPGLYAAGDFGTAGGLPANNIARWDGVGWSALGNGLAGYLTQTLTVFDDGNGPALFAGGDFAGSLTVDKWSSGATITLSATQTCPPGSVYIHNANLTPGREYFNVFSMDLCPGGPGTGGLGLLGGCITTPANMQWVHDQLLSPVGTEPFHVIAPSSYVSWGPFPVPPGFTVDAVCFDFTGGVIGATSPVVRLSAGTGPTINSVSPISAPAGALITVSGCGLLGATVTIDGVPVATTSVTATEITFANPAGVACNAALVVTDAGGQSVSTIINPAPSIASLSPSQGLLTGGANITVNGTGFTAGTTVTVGGLSATVMSVSSTQLSVSVPSGAAGPANLVVTTPGGCTASATFTYLYPPLSIAWVNPLNAAPGSTVTVSGDGFQPGLTLSVGGVPVVPATVGLNSITFTNPANIPCDTTLVITNPNATVVSTPFNPGFTMGLTGSWLPAPFGPGPSGPAAGGTNVMVLVFGNGVTAPTLLPGTTVTVGGTPVTVNPGWIPSMISFNTPPGSPGPVNVVVTIPGGCSQTATFTYL